MLLIGVIAGVIWMLLVVLAVVLCAAAARGDADSERLLRSAIF